MTAMRTWNRLSTAVLVLVLAACGGGAPAPAPAGPTATVTIAQIDLEVRRDPGSAFVTYHADGRVVGGHLSGDDEPFVHQEEATLAPAVRARLWAAATAALDTPPGTTPPADDTSTLTLTLSDGRTVAWRWAFGAEPTEPTVRALADLVREHHIGGW